MIRETALVTMVAFASLLACGPSAENEASAEATSPAAQADSVFEAKIDGQLVNFADRPVYGSFVILSEVAGRNVDNPVRIFSVDTRKFSISAHNVDLDNLELPATLGEKTVADLSRQEMNQLILVSFEYTDEDGKSWGSMSGAGSGPDSTKQTITIESRDGDRIRGTFQGTLGLDDSDETIDITDGRFDVILQISRE